MSRRTNPLLALAVNILLPHIGGSTGSTTQTTAAATSDRELGELRCISELRDLDGSVTLLIGRRNSGKSVLAARLAELLGRPVFAVSPEQPPPRWISEMSLEDIADVPPPYSTLILDDIPVYLSSHDYHHPLVRDVEKLIPVVRHRRKLHLVIATQLSSLADKYTMDADLVLLKPPSLLFEDIERSAVRKIQQRAESLWKGKSDQWIHRHVYVLSSNEEGMVRVQKAGRD